MPADLTPNRLRLRQHSSTQTASNTKGPFPVPEKLPPPDNEPAAEIPIEDALDLHAFRPRDIEALLEEYLHAARRKGIREARIIHGKGIGVQREIVASVLRRHPAVESFGPAPAERGHWGATIVRLRPQNPRSQGCQPGPQKSHPTRRHRRLHRSRRSFG